MKNIPSEIYLQSGDYEEFNENTDFNSLDEVTWSTDNVFNNDIKYILFSQYEQLQAENVLQIMVYELVGGDQLTKDTCTEQFLINKETEFCMAVTDIAQMQSRIVFLVQELNSKRAENMQMKNLLRSFKDWHKNNTPNYPEYFEEFVCEEVEKILNSMQNE